MKKIKKYKILVIMVLVATVISSCGTKQKRAKKDAKKLETEMTQQVKEEKTQQIIGEFDGIIKKEGIEIKEVIEFIDNNITKVDQENADYMILRLEKALTRETEKNTKELQEKDKEKELDRIISTNIFLKDEHIPKIKNEDLRKCTKNILDRDYKIVSVDNEIIILIDYDKLLKYSKYISKSTSEYLGMKANEIANPVSSNNEVKISYENLSERLSKLEKYLLDYPNSEKYEEVLKYYRKNLIIYLRGTVNKEIIDFNDGDITESEEKPNKNGINGNEHKKEYDKIPDKLLASYKEVANNNKKDNITPYIIRKYLETIEINNNLMNEEVQSKILSLVNEAINFLEEKRINVEVE